MKEQSDRRPRLVRAAMLAVKLFGNEHRLDRVRFVVAIQKLTQAPGEKRHQLGNFAVRDIPEPATQSKKLADARNTLRTDLRRWFQKEWLQVARAFSADHRLAQTLWHPCASTSQILRRHARGPP